MPDPERLPFTDGPRTMAEAHELVRLRMEEKGENIVEAMTAVGEQLKRETAALRHHMAGHSEAMARLLADIDAEAEE